MILTVALVTMLACIVLFGTVYACACAYFWQDERKRRSTYRAREAYSALRYVRVRDTIPNVREMPTINLRKV